MTTAALTNGTQVSGRCSRASQVRHHSVYEIVLRFPDILLLHWPRDCEEKKKKQAGGYMKWFLLQVLVTSG
jgi:hypothetical protein